MDLELSWKTHESRGEACYGNRRVFVSVQGTKWQVQIRLREGTGGEPEASAQGSADSHAQAKERAAAAACALLAPLEPPVVAAEPARAKPGPKRPPVHTSPDQGSQGRFDRPA